MLAYAYNKLNIEILVPHCRYSLCGLEPQIRQLCLFKIRDMWKVASLIFFFFFFYLHTYQRNKFKTRQSSISINNLIPRKDVLFQKPTVTHLVKKFPAFYETRWFIIVLTRLRHWSVSWFRWIQFTLPPCFWLFISFCNALHHVWSTTKLKHNVVIISFVAPFRRIQ